MRRASGFSRILEHQLKRMSQTPVLSPDGGEETAASAALIREFSEPLFQLRDCDFKIGTGGIFGV